MSGDLPEIPEHAAEGRVAELYAEIRAAVGLPLVNLVYRTLAATGRLEAAWTQLRPNLADPAIQAAADAVVAAGAPPHPARVPPAALAAISPPDELIGVRSTIAAYMHANPRNLVAVSALLHAEPANASLHPAPPAPTGAASAAASGWHLLPMADLATLAPATRALLDELAAPIVAPGDQALVPSLLRHFAHSPALLAVLWTAVRPAVAAGQVAELGAAVEAEARARATGLPHRVAPLADPDTRVVLERFAFTISRMIVMGALLERAVADD